MIQTSKFSPCSSYSLAGGILPVTADGLVTVTDT